MPKRKDKTQSPEERLQEMLVPESEQPYPVPKSVSRYVSQSSRKPR